MPKIRRSPQHASLQRILVGRRAAAKLSQLELAERLGRPQSFVSKYEQGERRLSVVELLEVADAIGCSAEDIMSELRRSAT